MKFAPFELNGGYMPSMMKEIHSDEAIPKCIWMFAETALQNLAEAHNAIIKPRVFQMKCMNEHHMPDPDIWEGSLIFLSTKNLNLPKGHARKLCPKFIGPWKVLRAWPEMSTYKLELLTVLQERHINLVFHVSLLRPYHASNDMLFSNRMHSKLYYFGVPEDQEWFIDELLECQWNSEDLEFKVHWSLGNIMWEPVMNGKDLEAPDWYLELQGVNCPAQLARHHWKAMPKDGGHGDDACMTGQHGHCGRIVKFWKSTWWLSTHIMCDRNPKWVILHKQATCATTTTCVSIYDMYQDRWMLPINSNIPALGTLPHAIQCKI